jgi:penicillin amidase
VPLHEFKLRGQEKITITRAQQGVPRATAATEPDLYRALGYCHAWDRGLQLLMMRVLGQGRACELLQDSPQMWEADLFFRRLGLHLHLEREVAAFSAPDRALLDAYCDGLNQALARRFPLELRALGLPREPWRPMDTILLARMIGYVSLAQSQGDLERLLLQMVQQGVSRDRLEALFPGRLHGLDEDLLRRVHFQRHPVPEAVRWACAIPRAMASNAWVVAGSKTRSGAPILAGDPHLEVGRLPAIWYEFEGHLLDRYVIAATMPGIPAFLIGRTPSLAWGVTYTFMDAEDSWIEDCREGTYRRHLNGQDRWLSFHRRTEHIHRKKHPSAAVSFYENDHGVLDGDPNGPPGLRLTSRWSAAHSGQRSLSGGFALFRARTVTEGMHALGNLEVSFNWLLADRDGHIGYQMSGLAPLRRPGASGLVPLPGWDPDNDWRGIATPQQLPRAYDPPQGFLVSANDDLNHLGQLGPLSPINASMGSWRARRITDLLSSRDDLDVDAMRRIQLDLLSLHALDWLPLLKPWLPDTPQGRLLATWDGRYTLQSRAAWLFETFYDALLLEVFGAVWGAAVHEHLHQQTATFVDFYCFFDEVLRQPTSPWFGDRTRDDVLQSVLHRALDCPIQPWSVRRQLTMRHLLLGGQLPLAAGFDVGPIALPGGRATIQQGQIYRSGGRDTSFAPSYRIVTDLSEDIAHTTLPGGPSDRRFSRHYTSSLDTWRRGQLIARRAR